jgi:hypothetical protein
MFKRGKASAWSPPALSLWDPGRPSKGIAGYLVSCNSASGGLPLYGPWCSNTSRIHSSLTAGKQASDSMSSLHRVLNPTEFTCISWVIQILRKHLTARKVSNKFLDLGRKVAGSRWWNVKFLTEPGCLSGLLQRLKTLWLASQPTCSDFFFDFALPTLHGQAIDTH